MGLPPPPPLPVTATTDSQSTLPSTVPSSRSRRRTTVSVTSASVPTGPSTSTMSWGGGMDSGKYSTPALNRPKATAVRANAATVPAMRRKRWSSAHRRAGSYVRFTRNGRVRSWKRREIPSSTKRWRAQRPATVPASSTAVSRFAPATARRNRAAIATSVQRSAGRMGREGVPSSFMNIAQRVGTMTSATKSELVSVTMRVLGRKPMNSPTSPGQKRSGAKAASVVAVAAMMGTATSPVAFLAASVRSHPSSRKR